MRFTAFKKASKHQKTNSEYKIYNQKSFTKLIYEAVSDE
jgi:hypothetical protein